jgi:conjugal transfer/entry exclusion protein
MAHEQTITIGDVEYDASNLSELGLQQIKNLQFVEAQIQQLQNEWAIADTARIGYSNALRKELSKARIK